jgi:transposase-like protein
MHHKKHPQQVREAVIQQVLTGQGLQEQIAKNNGVGLSTLKRWLREAKNSGGSVMTKKEKRPQDWTREERLDALLEAAKLSEEELGAWCRKKGLHYPSPGKMAQRTRSRAAKSRECNFQATKKRN